MPARAEAGLGRRKSESERKCRAFFSGAAAKSRREPTTATQEAHEPEAGMNHVRRILQKMSRAKL